MPSRYSQSYRTSPRARAPGVILLLVHSILPGFPLSFLVWEAAAAESPAEVRPDQSFVLALVGATVAEELAAVAAAAAAVENCSDAEDCIVYSVADGKVALE